MFVSVWSVSVSLFCLSCPNPYLYGQGTNITGFTGFTSFIDPVLAVPLLSLGTLLIYGF